MSKRTVNDPSLHGWINDNGKWVWEGGATTGHIEDGTIQGEILTWDTATANWTPDDTMIVKGGNVGIGPSVTPYTFSTGAANLTLSSDRNNKAGAITLESPDASVKSYLYHDDANGMRIATLTDHPMTFRTNNQDRVTIDATGNVGIGAPAGNEKLRLEESGQATFRVVTTSVDGAANLYLNAGTKNWGIKNEATTRNFVIRDLTAAQDRLTIDSSGDATFSGSVTANRLLTPLGGFGYGLGAVNNEPHLLPYDANGNPIDNYLNLGRPASEGAGTPYRFKNGYFSGTVDAAGFTVNGVPIGGGASGNFVDKDTTTAQTMNSTLQAPDFIASSDERLKDNITTAPVGLIDSLKGREWDWKESGEKGSGVVAQELEQVLPHLVHTDDEGMKSVSYNGLVAYLIEEVKALRAEVEELKS